jgi:hypothetical protein
MSLKILTFIVGTIKNISNVLRDEAANQYLTKLLIVLRNHFNCAEYSIKKVLNNDSAINSVIINFIYFGKFCYYLNKVTSIYYYQNPEPVIFSLLAD